MKTAIPSPAGIERNWHLIDAEDAVLGRLASKAAHILMGKHKASYTPFLDTGDHVIVVNAAKVRLTGRKEEQKIYRRHSGYPGGLTETKARTTRRSRWHWLFRAGPSGPAQRRLLGGSIGTASWNRPAQARCCASVPAAG